jgi:bleomycin hydrolase
MAVNLIHEYGLVPQSVYPESYNTSHSAQLDAMLNSKLREFALALRRSMEKDLSGHGTGGRAAVAGAIEAARKIKRAQMKEIYRILAICCGTPPQPSEKVRPLPPTFRFQHL